VTDTLPVYPLARSRAVAAPPIEALLGCVQELAKRWIAALILERPLQSMARLPLEEFARHAPSLCAGALQALQSEAELHRLTGEGAPSGREESAPARRLAAITAASGMRALVEAVEALRGVLWDGLLDELRASSARQVGDASDRLAHVCAAILAAAADGALLADAASTPVSAEAAFTAPGERAGQVAGRIASPPLPQQAAVVDEQQELAASPARSPRERPLSWDESPPIPPRGRTGGIEIRDERGAEADAGPTAWIRSIGGQLERFEQDRLPFAVLLVELVDIQRSHDDEQAGGIAERAGRLERALAAALDPRSGSLTRERPGRYWLVARQTDRAGARDLAERLADEVAAQSTDLQWPLAVAIGAALCPEDAREAAALAAHADVGLYADRAAVRAAGRRTAAPVDGPA
jgi:GGDEF domain-containing protein